MYIFLKTIVSKNYEIGLEENSLALIEIEFSLEYKLEREAATSSILLFYTSLLLTFPSLLSSFIPINLLSYYSIS